MTDYMTEEEQVELLKSWAKQYGMVVLSGIAIAIVIMTGWRYWKERQVRLLSHASAVYDEMLTVRAQNDIRGANTQANKIQKHYPKTVYSEFASLMIARNAAANHDYTKAQNELQQVLTQSRSASLRQIARIRLARVKLADNKPQDALETLEKIEDKNFVSLIDETRGDIYFSMNEPAKARDYYKKALEESSDTENLRPILQMKYDDLAIPQKTG